MIDNWLLWELIAEHKTRERSLLARAVPSIPRDHRDGPGLRRRLAGLLVWAGLRLDAEAGRAVLSPLQNQT